MELYRVEKEGCDKEKKKINQNKVMKYIAFYSNYKTNIFNIVDEQMG